MRTRISSICQRKKYVICLVSVHIGGIVAKVRLHVIQISQRILVHVDDHLGNGNKTRQNTQSFYQVFDEGVFEEELSDILCALWPDVILSQVQCVYSRRLLILRTTLLLYFKAFT